MMKETRVRTSRSFLIGAERRRTCEDLLNLIPNKFAHMVMEYLSGFRVYSKNECFLFCFLSRENRYECFYENRSRFAFVRSGYDVDIGHIIVVECRAR